VRIAIVGTGVAGLAAAHRLAPAHELTIYEAGDHVGGHVHTHEIEVAGRTVAVDTGFIVFNTSAGNPAR
jgi:predicted NAD/FAD-binding protein